MNVNILFSFVTARCHQVHGHQFLAIFPIDIPLDGDPRQGWLPEDRHRSWLCQFPRPTFYLFVPRFHSCFVGPPLHLFGPSNFLNHNPKIQSGYGGKEGDNPYAGSRTIPGVPWNFIYDPFPYQTHIDSFRHKNSPTARGVFDSYHKQDTI